MELKVWVEGIQRIVCGVNEKTTCQDVVFALAHATGKTGRFTLIERWRNSERLLAPNEQPLKVLLKWGEHSNDVQFILQWSPLDSSSANANKSGHLQSGNKSHALGGIESSCSDNSSSHSPSPLSKSNNPYVGSPSGGGGGVLSPLSQVNGPVTKKPSNSGSSSSYTSNISSDSRLGSSFSQNCSEGLVNNILNNTDKPHNGDTVSHGCGMMRAVPQRLVSNDNPVYSSNSPNGKVIENGPSSVQSLGKFSDSKLSSPPPYREPPSPVSHSTPPLITSPAGMNSPALKSLPPYREPPPPNLSNLPLYINKSTSGNSPVSGIINSSNSTGIQPSVFSHGNVHSNTNGVVNGNSFGVSSNHKDLPRYSAVSSNSPQQDSMSSANDVDTWKKDQSLMNGDTPSNQNGSISKSSPNPQNSNSQYRDLIRVVNSQREKLTSQQAELTQFDAEIMFWEGKAREQQRHMDLINKEISRLEVVSAQHENQVLSLAHLEEENEYAQMESVALKSEINSLRAELEKCDGEIEQCKKRIRLLVDELHSTQNQMAQRQEEWLQKEASTLAEIDRLRRELEIVRRETLTVNNISGTLEQDVQSMEASLSEKKKQMERLVAAMKEANLQSLSIQPPEELIEAHHRSGSTRRMIGSPRQLENAAPTSKNPHGVWV